MGEPKARETDTPQEKKPDRLATVVAKKVEHLEVDGRELTIRKWRLHTSLVCMEKLGDILTEFIGGLTGQTNIAALMKGNVMGVLRHHEDKIVSVLVETLTEDNFEDAAKAEEWIRDLGAAEVLEIFTVVSKQNIRPLVKAVGDLGGVVAKIVARAGGQKVSQPQTS